MTLGEIPGKAIDAGKAVLTALPPAFLLLCLINAAFIAAVLWFLDVQLAQRMELANKILDACLQGGVLR